MSLFQSAYAMTTQYCELTFTQIEAGTSAAPVLFCQFYRNSKIAYILNETDAEVAIIAVAPNGDVNNAAQRLLFLKLGAGNAINFNNYFQDIEPNTQFYVYRSDVTAATMKKLQMLIWG